MSKGQLSLGGQVYADYCRSSEGPGEGLQ